MLNKLQGIKARYEELTRALSGPDAMSDQTAWRAMVKEHAQLEEIVTVFDAYMEAVQSAEDCKAMLGEHLDAEMREMVHAELNELHEKAEALTEQLKIMLLPKDPNDDKNVIIEIRAGTGGDEAALFGADLLRMYQRYAERHGFKSEFLNENMTEMGGVKEVALSLSGRGAYSRMKFESGVHRVQRVPETESQGRIHTSTATVAVLPEVDEVDIDINPGDLRIDTYRASGHGGQYINRTDSAVRITHLPTGIVVQCQNERSQMQNKEEAMNMLRAKLYTLKKEEEEKAVRGLRGEYKAAEWGNQIRSYVLHPYKMVKDHRTGFENSNINQVMDGDIQPFIEDYLQKAL